MMTEIYSCLLSQYLWYNDNIQADGIFRIFVFSKKYQLYFTRFYRKWLHLELTRILEKKYPTVEVLLLMGETNESYSRKIEIYY